MRENEYISLEIRKTQIFLVFLAAISAVLLICAPVHAAVNTTSTQAGFTANTTSGNAPLPVKFTDISTGQNLSYAWDFGDGATSTRKIPTHTFAAEGSYTVILTVTGDGGTDAAQQSITVLPPPTTPTIQVPVVAFTANRSTGNPPLAVKFTDRSVGTNLSYLWDFGDGASSHSRNPVHSFTAPGTFTVVHTVSNSAGSNETSIDIVILSSATAPVAAFTMSSTSGSVPLTVQFTDQSQGAALTYSWSFGDGGTSQLQNPEHLFAESGTFTVELTVTNPDGSDTAQNNVEVLSPGTTTAPVPNQPVANFAANTTLGIPPLAVQFSDTSTGENLSFYWMFGDGATSALQNPVHVFSGEGDYTIRHRVSNTGGISWANRTTFIRVSQNGVIAEFTADPTTGLAPVTVTFTDQSQGQDLVYFWDFGDEETSSEQNPEHTYYYAGSYTVSLRVEGSDGWDFENKTAFIEASAGNGTVAFSVDPASGFAPLTVRFTDISDVPGIRSRAWDFGDGTTGTGDNPSHTYARSNFYHVTLTLDTDEGSRSVTQWYTVQVLNDFRLGRTVDGTVGGLPWTPSQMPEGWAFDYEIPTGDFLNDIPGELSPANAVSNAVSTMGVLFSAGADGRQEVRIDRIMVQDMGGVVTIEDGGILLSYPGFGIRLLAESSTDANDIISAVPLGYHIIGDSLAADLTYGKVNTSYDADLTDLPESLSMDATIFEGADAVVMDNFNQALLDQGLEVKDVALVVHYTKTNMTLRDASVTMEIPAAWVQNHGGEGVMRMIRVSDEGDVQILGTQQVTSGDTVRFVGTSPNGLSLFGLVAVGEPSVNPASESAPADATVSDVSPADFAPDSYGDSGAPPDAPSSQFMPALPEFGIPDISGSITDFLNSFLHIGVILAAAVGVLLFFRRIRRKGSDDILLNWHSEFKDDGTRPKKL